jgi:putative ABC transport system permease protein
MRFFWHRDHKQQELQQELQSHLQMAASDRLERGESPEHAQQSIRRQFGNVALIQQVTRDQWGWRWLEEFLQDVRYGARMLRKNLGFSAVAILTVAIGIGANTAIFGVVNAVLLRPLAMEDPARVVYLQESWRDVLGNVAVGNFVDIAHQSNSFASLSASNNTSFNLATQDAPERVQGERATADYFTTFGVQPMVGRVFTSDEDKPGHAQVVVVSERLWRTRLRADSSIIGQSLRVNDEPYTVVGVMPKTFDPLLSSSDIWIPEAFTADKLADHDNHYLNVMGRLKPGVSLTQAQSELNVIALRLQRQYPLDNKGRGLLITALTTVLLGNQRVALWMMLAAVGFVLLIACANIANLQLVKSRVRQKEIALRAALGASPRRILRQLLTENVVLGLGGGVMGVLLAFWGVSWLVAKGPAEVPRLAESTIDATTLAFACAVTLFASILFGLAPALRSASSQLSQAFRDGAGTSGGSRDRVRSVLVVAEVALALILMTGAGVLVRSALLVSHLDAGFNTSDLVVGRVGLPDSPYHDPIVARQTFERIVTAAAGLPGVQSAAAVSRAPLAGGGSSNGLLAEGKPFDLANLVDAQLQVVSPGYISTVQIPLKAGRDFLPQDTRDKTLVTIVNQTLARTMWPGENPVGKRFACCEAGPKGRMDPVWHEVVGVVADVRAWGLDQQIQPQFYLPMTQVPASAWDWIGRTMDVVVRTQGGPIPLNALRMAVASIAPGVPIYRLSSMQQKISGTLERSHFDTFLLAIFAGTALLLSSVGIYGVLSYTVAQRSREIGIRMALGASQAQVMRDVLGHGIRLTTLGLMVGIAGALMVTHLLASLLYGVASTDALTFVAVSLILATVALIASYLPSRRAMRVDPLVALRYE